jgi:hypothetical protein
MPGLHDLALLQKHLFQTRVTRHRDFFSHLRQRMDALGWDRESETYQAAARAAEATHALVVVLHNGGYARQPAPPGTVPPGAAGTARHA